MLPTSKELVIAIATATFLSLSTLAVASADVVAQSPRQALADPADLIPWREARNPRVNAESVADASLWLWDGKAAGAHGPVRSTPDGDLIFADGTPARFWGTTLCYGASFPENDKDLKALVDGIVATGYNLVRFHHNDHIWGSVSYLKNGNSFELDPSRIAILDKVMKAFIDRGVYIYLDIVDSRGWTAEMGMEGWKQLDKAGGTGWKGVFPIPAMVNAWKRATDELLNHVNPLTGRSLAEEPAVACIEILNENGPFWDWGFKTTPPVQKWFDAAWNQWLLKKYGNRDALAKTWTDATGTCGLFDDEDPAKGNVYRPQLQPLQTWQRSNRSKARGACRYNDFIAFFRELTTGFYKEASTHLRSHGFKGQIIGSHELRGPQNQLAEIEGAGSISAHLYSGQKLAWESRPGVAGITVDGVDIRSRNWFTNMARINIAGIPGWNNEWTVSSLCYRADSHLAVASMMALQGIDGSVHFGWSGRWAKQKMPNKDITVNWISWRKAFHNSFSSLHDSPSMAIHRICAAMMRRGDLPSPRYTAHIAHSAEDAAEQNLHAVGLEAGTGTVGGAALFLPSLHRLQTTFFDTAYDGNADVVFSTGRSASGDYRKAKHAVILGDNPWCDRYHKKRDLLAPARILNPKLVAKNLDKPATFRISFGYEQPLQVTFAKLEGAIEMASLPAQTTPIGVSQDGRYTLGWCDDRFLVLPAAGQFDRLGKDGRWLYRFYLTAAKRWGIKLEGNSINSSVYVSDNGVLHNDWGTGTQLIDSPLTQVVAGFAGLRNENRCRNLSVKLSRPYGVVALTSCDGNPIAESKRMFLVATARIQNTGTEYTVNADGKVRFTKTGEAPMLVEGLHGSLELSNLDNPENLVVYALDVTGKRLGKVDTKVREKALSFPLNPRWKTIWFEVAAPSIEAPIAQVAEWPGKWIETPQPLEVKRLTVAEYNQLLVANEKKSVAEDTPESGGNRISLTDVSTFKPYQVYGNMKASIAKVDGTPALNLSLGKYSKQWSAGMWFNLVPLPGLAPADCRGISFFSKGDGTLPRDCFLILSWMNVAGKEIKSKSRNLPEIFENTDWREIILAQSDFPGETVDFSRLKRLDFGVVSNLVVNRHTISIGAFELATAPGAAKTPVIANLDKRLPPVTDLPQPILELPLIPEGKITANGDPEEDIWSEALGFALDEAAVPSWQHVGSVIAGGVRKNAESARFWMLATGNGLAVLADINKNGAPIVNRGKDWHEGDCVEIFVDKNLSRGKPSKQLFFAYRRPALDRACSNARNARVGRIRTPQGYALEILIPWSELGVAAKPGNAFGIDLQVDFGGATGRELQMTLGTGTNEAWFKSDNFLTVKLLPPKK